MDTKLNYVSPALREIHLRCEENILSGEINDVTVTNPWDGVTEEEW